MIRTTIVVLALAAAASAQGIQKWRTPDGKLHFGSRPPAGSTLVGESRDASRVPDTAASGSGGGVEERDGRFSVTASLRRKKLEREIAKAEQDLAKIRDEKKYVEGLRLAVRPGDDGLSTAGFVASAVNFQGDKAQRLKDLEKREEGHVRRAEGLRGELLALQDEVREHYGALPVWWRSVGR